MPVIARAVPGIALLALALGAFAGAVRLLAAGRIPDGALAMGLTMALGSSGVVWLLVVRRVRRGRAPVSEPVQ